jgi:para-nitrobenzyl esterase
VTETIVDITAGPIRGQLLDGVHAFKGIPYGADTGAANRFRPPQPPAPWHEVRDALELGPSCPQQASRPGGWMGETHESEDSLVLNVWSGGLDGANRPVMVWLHGGGFAIGSGSWPLYDGANLARRGDTVIVTLNHRLGALGFAHLGELMGAGFESSGNNGMLDIVQALEWVRDNIARFGGDASNVTIFGESGGGSKVCTLLAMPAARGLFHRAVIQSGPTARVTPVSRATAQASKLLAELGIAADDLTALQAVPAEQIVTAQLAAGDNLMGLLGFSPVLDGITVTADPTEALRDGTAPDVPLMIGCTRDEATLFIATDPAFRDPSKLDDAALERRLDRFGLGANRDRILTAYRTNRPDETNTDLYIAILTDQLMRVPSIRLAEDRIAGGGSPVFMFLFTWAAGPLRSGHGFELPFVFDNVGGEVLHSSATRERLAAEMSGAWLAFAHTGNPSHDGIGDWPAYDLDRRTTMVFDRSGSANEDDPWSADREAWDGIEARGIGG